jgi:arylsulfatase
LPTLVAAAGNPNIIAELLKGKTIDGVTYKNHLDGYDQTALITGKGPSARHEIFYFGESTLGALRLDDYKYQFIDQPNGWLGNKVANDAPTITNLRLDPYERTAWYGGTSGSLEYFEWYKYQFWRFVLAQKTIAKAAETLLEYPPMQKGASFNLSALKAELEAKMKAAQDASSGKN